MSKVVTRIAPSPTGNMHIGTARTALFSYLYARRHGGTFILRFEDTDKARSKKEYEEDIREGMHWLGLDYDAMYRQSERTDIYKKYIETLLAKDLAYVSNEDSKMKPGEKVDVIRLRNQNKDVSFDDAVHGTVRFNTTELGDFVIARSIDDPVFHLAVVIDDYEMKVTHAIRGDDLLSNTPRQILIGEALGFPRVTYAHLPMILAPDRSKMSKRHGAVSLTEYRARGYLPEAIVNYLALLGWNPGTEQEIFSLAELTELFDLSRIQKSGAIFNIEKLAWFNREYLKALSLEDFERAAHPFLPATLQTFKAKNEPGYRSLLTELQGRIETLGDLARFDQEGEFGYYIEAPVYDKEGLLWKGKGGLPEVHQHLSAVRDLIETIPTASFQKENVKEAVWSYAEEQGRGGVLWPLRFALSGRERSPDPFLLCEILGKNEVLARIFYALEATQKKS